MHRPVNGEVPGSLPSETADPECSCCFCRDRYFDFGWSACGGEEWAMCGMVTVVVQVERWELKKRWGQKSVLQQYFPYFIRTDGF